MQMPISTQRKLCLLVLLQKKYLYTCKNIVTKPNLEEFLRKLFEQYRIENCGKQYWICVATGRFFFYFYFYCNLFCFLLRYLFTGTYWFFYLLLCINVVNLLSIKKILFKIRNLINDSDSFHKTDVMGKKHMVHVPHM